jgi:hypothetical protein
MQIYVWNESFIQEISVIPQQWNSLLLHEIIWTGLDITKFSP